jgi:pSer/pThr/pTyr-binding forkhead associated (FHA) protein
MSSKFRFLLLPILGAIAAIVAFKLAGPFEGSLDRPGLSILNPQAQFTFGTRWGDVNRIAFGALLCGLFCFGLTVGRRSISRTVGCTLLGAFAGGVINYLTDSGADLIGLAIASKAGIIGNMVASVAWCVLVPAGISLAVLLAIGPTPQRLWRAVVGTVFAAIASYLGQMAGTVIGGHGFVETVTANGTGVSLQAFIPIWRCQEIAVGVAIGLALAFADSSVRAGTLRLILGRNEWREWSLDHVINRIGSAEDLEIPLGRVSGLDALHAVVAHDKGRFMLTAQGGAVVLNGSPVTQADLKHGDTFQLGSATVQFLLGSEFGVSFHRRPGSSVYSHVVNQPRMVAAALDPAPSVLASAVTIAPPAGGTFAVGVLVDAAGGQYHLPPGQYGVGREADNAICLSQESTVSRHHAKIVVSDGGTLLEDMGSTNGTTVNGNRLRGETSLRPGDRIQFGCVEFTVAQTKA